MPGEFEANEIKIPEVGEQEPIESELEPSEATEEPEALEAEESGKIGGIACGGAQDPPCATGMECRVAQGYTSGFCEYPTEMCANSPIQLCKMMCPALPQCALGECVMRDGTCCEFECETIPVPGAGEAEIPEHLKPVEIEHPEGAEAGEACGVIYMGQQTPTACEPGLECKQSICVPIVAVPEVLAPGTRKEGETCGWVFGPGYVGECETGLECKCVGVCEDPMVMDAPSTCVKAETQTPVVQPNLRSGQDFNEPDENPSQPVPAQLYMMIGAGVLAGIVSGLACRYCYSSKGTDNLQDVYKDISLDSRDDLRHV